MENKKTALVVMAAGMGSRFGGLKQIAPVGPNGEIILDFSIFDAVNAGFNKVIFIIKKENEADFRKAVGKRIENLTDVCYAYQDTKKKLPDAFLSLGETRKKPWGTAHAILCAKESISNLPFAVINADDYYGKSAYKLLHQHLQKKENMCMCGFKLGNTLTENGTVSRGVCKTENGFLKSVTEHTALDKNSGFPFDTIVSMNMWGLNSRIFPRLEADFSDFLKNIQNPEKEEFFLPAVIDRMIQQNGEQVSVLSTDEKWYGITYKEDLPVIQTALTKMTEEGLYYAKCAK